MAAVEYLTLLVVVIYGILLGIITPFVIGGSRAHGSLVPAGIAITVASLLWLVMTWFGLNYESVWIWLAVMLVTPTITFPAVIRLRKVRVAQDELELKSL